MAKIYISPGHGNNDPGAVLRNSAGQVIRREADDNLVFCKLLNSRLRAVGYSTRTTRTENNFTPVNRAQEANEWGADLLICKHRNGWHEPSANGWEVYTAVNFSQGDDRIAQALHRRVTDLGIFRNRGVKRHNFGRLVEARMPAILPEFGFITNANDNRIYDENLDRLVNVTVQAIQDVFPVSAQSTPQDVLPVPSPTLTPEIATTLHRVQIGSFRDRNNAERQLREAQQFWSDAFISQKVINGVVHHRVQIGSFGLRENATNHLNRAHELGFKDAFIKTVTV